ncbi:hypothetical protein RYX36_019491 [Vicia faba]
MINGDRSDGDDITYYKSGGSDGSFGESGSLGGNTVVFVVDDVVFPGNNVLSFDNGFVFVRDDSQFFLEKMIEISSEMLPKYLSELSPKMTSDYEVF